MSHDSPPPLTLNVTSASAGEALRSIELLAADVGFLLDRSLKAGSCSFTSERDTGLSSNSIVAIAYGTHGLKDQVLPGDGSDLAACEKMWLRLPDHRKTENAIKAMERARREIRGPSALTAEISSGYGAEGDAESAYKLAMMCLQSERYGTDMDYRDATDTVIAWAAPWKRHTEPRSATAGSTER